MSERTVFTVRIITNVLFTYSHLWGCIELWFKHHLKTFMKTPISYYGGKQTLSKKTVPLFPEHVLYCEPFCGGAAEFFAKPKSAVEVLNDTNKELINFYRTVQNDFVSLEKFIKITLHSRDLHRKASVTYNNPDMFTEIQRAWAVWTLATQSFSSILDGSWGYDKKKRTTSLKIKNRREAFTEELAIRLQDVQIECTDALRIIKSRDAKDSFMRIDPPYVNSDCAHYDGYSWDDFDGLLKVLEKLEGKFMLSSYHSPMLAEYVKRNGWQQKEWKLNVSVNKGSGSGKTKVEVITANYDLMS